MRYPLFLSDFDGTLVRPDGTVSEENIRAIARYRAAGGVFAVCTGRGLTSIVPRLKELGITDGLVVAYQGATVADVATGKLLKDDGFFRGGRAESGAPSRTGRAARARIHGGPAVLQCRR